MDEVSNYGVRVRRVFSSILLFTQGETPEERCKLEPVRSKKRNPGTYMLLKQMLAARWLIILVGHSDP